MAWIVLLLWFYERWIDNTANLSTMYLNIDPRNKIEISQLQNCSCGVVKTREATERRHCIFWRFYKRNRWIWVYSVVWLWCSDTYGLKAWATPGWKSRFLSMFLRNLPWFQEMLVLWKPLYLQWFPNRCIFRGWNRPRFQNHGFPKHR